MDEPALISAQEQYQLLLSKVKVMEPYLQLLHRDYLLMTSYDINFSYAIDFHEIWNYAEPLTKFLGGQHQDHSPIDQDGIFKRQIARAKLFYGLGADASCILLPPYVNELDNKIKLISEKLLRDGVPDINNDLRRQLDEIASNKVIQDAVNKFLEEKDHNADNIESIPIFLEENIRKLLFYISGAASQGLDILNDLLFSEHPKILEASEQWPKLASFIQKVTQAKSSKWYSYFQRVRPNQNSDSSNFYDAKAIDLVLAINNHIVANKRILVLVSGAPTMERVFKMQAIDLPPKYLSTVDGVSVLIPDFHDSIPLFRPIETYYYLTLFSADTNEGILKELGAELDRINQVYILGESVKKLEPVCDECVRNKRDKCVFSDNCKSIHIYKQLKSHQKHFDEYEKVLLIQNRLSIIEPAWERINAQREKFGISLNKTTLTLIEFLAKQREDFDGTLQKLENNLRSLMDNQIRDALISAIDLTLYRNEIGGGLKKFTRTEYRVNFDDVEIETLLNQIEFSRNNNKSKLLAESIKELIDRAFDEQKVSKKQLLWAVLLLCYSLYDQAIELVDRTLNTQKLDNKKEFLFIRALTYYLKGDLLNVEADCETTMLDYPDDPRFFHLYGLAKGLQVSTAKKIFDNSLWDQAIRYEKKAYNLAEKNSPKNISLLSAIVNNLAYFHSRRGQESDLNQATHYIEQLKELSPSFENEPEYLNTLGWVNRMRASRSVNQHEKKMFARQSIANFKKALEIAQMKNIKQIDISEYESDLQEAEQQLNNIVQE